MIRKRLVVRQPSCTAVPAIRESNVRLKDNRYSRVIKSSSDIRFMQYTVGKIALNRTTSPPC